MTARRSVVGLLLAVATALLAGRWFAGLYADRAFFHALDAETVWRAGVTTRAAVRLVVFASVLAFVFANLFAVRQSIVSLVLPRSVGDLEIPEAIPTRRLTFVAMAGALLLAMLFALVDHDWTMVLQAFRGLPFGETDPYFERDLGFYVHWLPFERTLYAVTAVLVLLTAVLVIIAYALTPSVRWDARGLYVSTWVRRHLGVLGGLAIALIAWDWRLDRFGLLSEGSGAALGLGEAAPFSAYDHKVLVPYLVVTSFLAMPLAAVFTWSVWRGWLRLSLILVSVLVVGGPVARTSLPLAARPAQTGAAADTRERPYRATRTLYTRRAYRVDRIAGADTTRVRAVRREELPRFVSAWDPAALMRAVALERRGTDVAALVWQPGVGGLEAAVVRGAPPETPPGAAWPVDRYAARGVDEAGGPISATTAVSGRIPGVLIYPGAARYALVADTLGRLAAPPFERTIERLGLAWDLQNPRLLAADLPTPRPRLVTERDAVARIERIVPFLTSGPTVTPLMRGDSLYWVAELFAVAAEYPLSERIRFAGRRAHLVHHAATAVVQAQTGRVLILPARDPDPVMRTWLREFPELFTARSDAPRWLVAALPPVIDGVLVQGAAFGRTGFLGDTIQTRSLARVDDADADLTIGPPTLFQIDADGTSAWGIPIESSGGGMAGMLTAVGGADPRTEFVPAARPESWTGVLERLQAAADEAGVGRTLAHARRGRVQVIPTTAGLAFVQSYYQWPMDGPPRVAGVAALLGDGEEVRVGRSLAEALGLVDDLRRATLPGDVFRTRVAALYDAMVTALRAGDWAAYGRAWADLGRLLGRPAP